MTTYKDAGVDIDAGNKASRSAYLHASATFSGRKGKMGAAVEEEGGFAGMLDMGDYFLVQNDDGTGSKMELAHAMNKYDTIGQDLLAMVADDAICMGAEVMSVSNTLDVQHVHPEIVDFLLEGLSNACKAQRIIIPGGEIAEVPGAVCSPVWNATAIGIVEKNKVIDTKSIREGDAIVSLKSNVIRSNGFSLVRKILSDAYGEHWHAQTWNNEISWGEIMLSPSIIYHHALLSVLGRYGEDRIIDIKGITHITGGGIADNIQRTLRKSGCGAQLTDLWAPHDSVQDLVKIGSVSLSEAYKTWNMGNGMLIILSQEDADAFIHAMHTQGMQARISGMITKNSNVDIVTYSSEKITY